MRIFSFEEFFSRFKVEAVVLVVWVDGFLFLSGVTDCCLPGVLIREILARSIERGYSEGEFVFEEEVCLVVLTMLGGMFRS